MPIMSNRCATNGLSLPFAHFIIWILSPWSADLNLLTSEIDKMAADQLSANRKETRDLIDAYLNLTRDVLPGLARRKSKGWPVSEDHCFQRIVLDNICGGVWYDHLGRPAYKHLTHEQAQNAVDLCNAIASDRVDINQLNKQSLIWRGKWRGSK